MRGLLDNVLRHPETTAEWWILLIVAFVSCAAALRITASAGGMGQPTALRSFVVSLFGLALILLGMTAARVLMPLAGGWLIVAAALFIFLGLVLPLSCFLLKGNYLVAFVAWLIGLAALAGVIMMLSAVFDVVAAGMKNAQQARDNKRALERISP